MPTALHTRVLTAAVTLLLSLAVLAAVLALPARTLAATHRSSCRGASSTGAKHRASTCSQSKHGATATAKAKAKTKAKPKTKHHRRHKRHLRTKKGRHVNGQTPAQTPSICEDGSAPIPVGNRTFTCNDGSEPECEDGSTPVLSSSGSTLVCNVAPEGPSGSEPVCADGSFPAVNTNGNYACEDGSEPACEGGSTPVVSNNGSTLVCAVTSGEEAQG